MIAIRGWNQSFYSDETYLVYKYENVFKMFINLTTKRQLFNTIYLKYIFFVFKLGIILLYFNQFL